MGTNTKKVRGEALCGFSWHACGRQLGGDGPRPMSGLSEPQGADFYTGHNRSLSSKGDYIVGTHLSGPDAHEVTSNDYIHG